MRLIDPATMPTVALASMNDTHLEEVNIVNTLAERLQSSEDEGLAALLQTWLTHTQQHFEREHALMQQSGFPAYPIHRQEHERVLARLQAVVQGFVHEGDRATLQRFVLEEWPHWFVQHVRTMDSATAHFARQRGIDA